MVPNTEKVSQVLCRIVFAGILTAIIVLGPSAVSAQADKSLTKALVGKWTPSSKEPNEIEKWALEFKLFSIEEFNADGSGSNTIYKGKICANPIRISHFRWSVINGVLLTTTDKGVDHDNIISIDRNRMVLFSIEHKVKEIRDRTAGCVNS